MKAAGWGGWMSVAAALLVLLAAFGCSAPQIRPTETDPIYLTPFRPAAATTPLPSATPTGLAPARPTPTVRCTNNLTFIKDLSIPDRTVIEPNATIDKRWEVENTGTCNWDERYQVRFLQGDLLGAQKEQPLFPARSGSRAEIRILFKAPAEAGTYKSEWQAIDPQGMPFGDWFSIVIVVKKGS
ncbi:MAG TPA: NBR1-Ig-like domain-containing protein [Anaerolineaceae bacterium]